jgi:sister-chromatid-cohesion protein PDS5
MKFERLNVSLQDTCFHVRQEFAQSLMKGLLTEQINSRYYALLFICAHEPDKALLQQVQNFLQKRFSTLEVLDTSLVRLIHMLAHHPDFTESVEDLMIFSQYFRFYLNCVATASNVSFLYHVAQKIKLSKDVVNMELNKVSAVLWIDISCKIITNVCI